MTPRSASAQPVEDVHGRVASGFEVVAEAFARNFSDNEEVGAAFAAVVDGQVVVDLWGGFADRARRLPWREDTLAGIFSGTKGLVATCLLRLVEDGALELERPVQDYWPEFGATGKHEIRVRHIVSHCAGVPGLATAVTLDEATDAMQMAELLAEQPSLGPPGASLVYHAMTFGWLSGELIRRIDGRSVGRFFRDEIATPLQLDAWIGLPADLDERVARLERGTGFGTLARTAEMGAAQDPVAWSIWANPPRFASDPLPANGRLWRSAELAGSNGIASARSVARLYGCLARGGEVDGIRLLRPDTVALGATPLMTGSDPYLGEAMSFGVGFQLQTDAARFGPVEAAFGHPGTGGSVHGAWPRERTGFSYVTSSLRETPGTDRRAAGLLDALHASSRRCVDS